MEAIKTITGKFITSRGAAEVLDVTVGRVQQLTRGGELPAIKLRTDICIDIEDLMEFRQVRFNEGRIRSKWAKRNRELHRILRVDVLTTRAGLLLTTKVAAQMLGVDTAYVTGLLAARDAPAVKFGRSAVFYYSDLIRLVRQEWERPRRYMPRKLARVETSVRAQRRRRLMRKAASQTPAVNPRHPTSPPPPPA